MLWFPLKKRKLLLDSPSLGERGPIIQSSALICLVKAHTFIAIIKHSNGAKAMHKLGALTISMRKSGTEVIVRPQQPPRNV